MAKQLTNVTTTSNPQIGTIMRRHEATNWFGTFFVSGTYAGATVNWQWSHATAPSGDTSGNFPLKDLSGNAVTSTSASGNDSFNSEFGTGKMNSDHIKLLVNVTGATTNTNLNVGFYDNQ